MISLLVALIIVGVALYLVDMIPMNGTVKRIIQVLSVLFVILYALQILGLWHGLPLR